MYNVQFTMYNEGKSLILLNSKSKHKKFSEDSAKIVADVEHKEKARVIEPGAIKIINKK